MAKPSKLPSGNWRVCLYLGKKNGKDVRKTITGKTKKDVETKAAKYIAENHLDDTPMTVGEAVDKYINDAAATRSPSTIRAYRTIQKNHIDGISSYMADRVTRDDIQTWVNDISKKYSPKTVRNAHGLVIPSIRAVRPSFSVDTKLPAKSADIVVIPTEEDVKKMLENASPELKKCIMLGAFCSLRRGEVCYLRFKDIKDGCISIHGDVVSDEHGNWIEKDHAKTSKSNRTVRAPEFVIEALGTGEPDQKVIDLKNPECITQRFYHLMKKLGMTYHFHLLRHYFASVLIAQGVPKEYVQALGGWENGGSLDRIYTHILRTSKNDFSKKASDYFSKQFNGGK